MDEKSVNSLYVYKHLRQLGGGMLHSTLCREKYVGNIL
jgi:hypothetical protein